MRNGDARELVQGNVAVALGALYAGCDFFAGYPITPSSEILEVMSREQPQRGGVFLQMEDELASISAVIGGAWGGSKAMTATSGPGFSLMQEGLSYAAMTETPLVIVDAQRGGPSTGQPTRPSQADVLQAVWGAHGDHPVIVLTASDVRECFEMTVSAFNLSETYRVPVILLIDEVLAHMRQDVHLPEPGELPVVNRRAPEEDEEFHPFGSTTFLPLGAGFRFNVTGLSHDEDGAYVKGAAAGEMVERINGRVRDAAREIAIHRAHRLEGAEHVVVAYGSTARAAESAVDGLREDGVAAGLLDLKTLWPFPDHLIAALAPTVRSILVPELNLGQLVREVDRAAARLLGPGVPVDGLNRVDGELIPPEQIRARVLEQARAAPKSVVP